MLKIAGWIITRSAVDDWRKAQPEVNKNSGWAIRSNIRVILQEREDITAVPFRVENIIQTAWPKMTTETRGNSLCILVRHVRLVNDENVKEFEPIPMNLADEKIIESLAKDGLKLGEWVTIPDPFEDEWPFAKRYPGKKCPPDPRLEY